MLNLLIAIMGDIFDRIQENAKAEFIFARAQIIIELELTLSKAQKENKEWFPTWLQVLVPTLESSKEDAGDWEGRVKALKKSICGVNEKLGESEKKREESEKKREKDVERLEKKLEESEKKREESEKKVDRMLSLMYDKMLDDESKQLVEELGVTVEDLEPKPTDAESKNKALKDLKKKREEESSRLEKGVEGLWKTLETSEEDQKAFKEKVEIAGKLKQAGLTLLKEEADRLWEIESEKLMEELGVTLEELNATEVEIKPQKGLRCTAQRDGEGEFMPGVITSLYYERVYVCFDSDSQLYYPIKKTSVKFEFASTAQEKMLKLKALKESREHLYEEVEGLWKSLEVAEDDQKAFNEKLEAAGKLKEAGQAMLKEEVGPLWDKESEQIMEELGVTVEELDPKPTDTESKNKAIKALLSTILEKEKKAVLMGWSYLYVSNEDKEPWKNKYREAKGDMLQELRVFKEENERLKKKSLIK